MVIIYHVLTPKVSWSKTLQRYRGLTVNAKTVTIKWPFVLLEPALWGKVPQAICFYVGCHIENICRKTVNNQTETPQLRSQLLTISVGDLMPQPHTTWYFSAFLILSYRKDLDGQTGWQVRQKRYPMFLIIGKERNRFSTQKKFINDKDWICPVKRNLKNLPPFTKGERFLLFPRWLIFELHWHLTESWHLGNNSKEKNTSQVLEDLLSGAQGAFLIIFVEVVMLTWANGKLLSSRTLLECTRHVLWVKQVNVYSDSV